MSVMLNTLPPEVDYQREFKASGNVLYSFSHPILGILGRLYLMPHREGSRIIWSPSSFEEYSAVQTHLEDFMEELIEELERTVRRLYKTVEPQEMSVLQ
jgi:hypothetical protein